MSLNTILLFLFVFFSVPEKIEQNKKTDFTQIIKKKDTNYFNLRQKIKGSSFDELNKFYKKCQLNNYELGEVCALNSLSLHYRKKSAYPQALKHLNEALTICENNNFIDAQLVSLNNLGIVYRKQDDIINALYYYKSVTSLAKKIKRKTLNNKISISIAKNSLGNIYASLKQYELAIKQFKKAIVIQKSNKNLKGLAINYQNIGKAYESLNLFDEALDNYQKSLKINVKNNSAIGKVICNNSIASLAIKKGNYNQALYVLKRIYPTAKTLKNKYYVSETLSNLGWAQLKLKNFKEADKNLNEALKLTTNLNNKLLRVDILHHISELFEQKKDLEKSYFYFKKAIELEKKTIGKKNNIYISNLISEQDTQIKNNDFKELQNETKIKSLQLTRNRNILIITLVTIALLSVVLYSIYKQHLLKNDQKIILLEQQALQAQMNPHFVFNALNSIKHYIINNEQKNAVYYLNKFSKLIRNILEVSKVKEVSLKEELNTMSLYMSIENIRFDNSISYIEKISSDLNTDTIKLPPLVLQPFLENSIWHGLSSKEGKKEIILSTKKISEELIEINIIDNGIGRKEALKINMNKSKSLKRNSVGITLTKERLTTFSNEFSNEFYLKYYDLKDAEGNPIGTKVTIQIPLS